VCPIRKAETKLEMWSKLRMCKKFYLIASTPLKNPGEGSDEELNRKLYHHRMGMGTERGGWRLASGAVKLSRSCQSVIGRASLRRGGTDHHTRKTFAQSAQ
jgi:hypothetical protein